MYDTGTGTASEEPVHTVVKQIAEEIYTSFKFHPDFQAFNIDDEKYELSIILFQLKYL